MPKLEDKQIQGLQRLLSLLNPDTLTKEDFLSEFKNVLQKVKDVEDGNKKEFKEIMKLLKDVTDKMSGDSKKSVEDIRLNLQNIFDSSILSLKSEINRKIRQIDVKLSEVKDGKDADEKAILAKLINTIKIPTIDELKDQLPVMGEEVRDALELLQGEERLDAKAISGLEDLIKKIIKSNRNFGGGGSSFSPDSFANHVKYGETPTGTVNGVNKEFTLDLCPNPVFSLKVYVGTGIMHLDEDYTFTASTKKITFVTAPPTGAVIRVDYIV